MGRLNLIIILLAAIITLVTVIIGVKQPDLHKQAMFTDEYHEFVEEDLPESGVSFSDTTGFPEKQITTSNTDAKPQPQKKIVKQIIRYRQPEQNQYSAPIAVPAPKVKTVNKVQSQPAKKETAAPPVSSQTQQVSKPVEKQKHVLTEQEEIIAWNIWRSNLQNQVMKDSKIRAPLGTVFKFSFTVDKYGNMSNIKVWSTSSMYTGLAVHVIKPVLSGYQHKPILNFPIGTKRVITNVTGGFVISTRTQYSSPSDYSDYEKVKRH